MSNEAQPKPAGPLEIVVNTIKAPELQTVLAKSFPPGVSLERFTAATVGAIRNNPQIFADADRSSLYSAIVECARRGLVPDGKQGVLAPFNTNMAPRGQPPKWVKKIQWMIMPQGIIDALAKVGITAYADSVYENDVFTRWNDDTGQHLRHEPVSLGKERGQRVGAFACGRTRQGVTYVEVMGMDELKRAMSKSKNFNKDTGQASGPWAEWPERMEQKSALHRLDKRMPGAGVSGEEEEFREDAVSVTPPNPVSSPTNAAISDDSKRPRGLQGLVEENLGPPAPVTVDHETGEIQGNHGEPF